MLQWLYDLLIKFMVGVADVSLWMLDQALIVAGWLLDAIVWSIQNSVGYLVFSSEDFGRWIIVELMGRAAPLMDTLNVDLEQVQGGLDGLGEVWQQANWFLPAGECIIIYGSALGTAAIIRGTRWLIGWIPGVDG